MKSSLKRRLSWVTRVPVLGRLILILVALWRAPEDHVRVMQSQARLDALEIAGRGRLDTLNRLLDSVAEINHRQQASDSAKDNLVTSVPVALRRFERLRASSDERITELQAAIDALRSTVGSEHDSTQPDARGRVDALEARTIEHASTLTYLLERVEFVRSELLFEFRYGASSENAPGATTIEPVVKIELPARGAKVNLGCGHIPLNGYINVDNRDLPTVDVVADVTQLPFEAGSISELYSAHFLEHFPEERLRRKILPYLLSLLEPGGRFRAVVPDAEAMIQQYVQGSYPYEDLKAVLYGGQDYDGDFHYTMFTPSSMSSLLQELGFSNVTVLDSGRRNGRALELEIEAFRPSETKK